MIKEKSEIRGREQGERNKWGKSQESCRKVKNGKVAGINGIPNEV